MSQPNDPKICFTFVSPDEKEDRITLTPKGEISEAYALLMELLVECIPVGVARDLAETHNFDHDGDTTLFLLAEQISKRVPIKAQDIYLPWQALNAKKQEVALLPEELDLYQNLRRKMQVLYPEAL